MDNKIKNRTEKLESHFLTEDLVSLAVNSENATPNPVVEEGHHPNHKSIMEERHMRENTANHKRGGRWIMVAVMTLMMMSVATALDVKTFDENLFEMDAFQEGDVVIILAESQNVPTVTITGTEIENKEMEKLEDGKYQGMMQVAEKGEYTITVNDGNQSMKTEIYVLEELNLNWDALEEKLESDKEKREITIQEAKEKAWQKLTEEQRKTLSEKIKEFMKNFWAWVFEGAK